MNGFFQHLEKKQGDNIMMSKENIVSRQEDQRL
jgi:hypothetical protein